MHTEVSYDEAVCITVVKSYARVKIHTSSAPTIYDWEDLESIIYCKARGKLNIFYSCTY